MDEWGLDPTEGIREVDEGHSAIRRTVIRAHHQRPMPDLLGHVHHHEIILWHFKTLSHLLRV